MVSVGIVAYGSGMDYYDRHPPTLCRDCSRAITKTAMRCRTCATRARGLISWSPQVTPSPVRRYLGVLRANDIVWIRAQGARLGAAKMARMFDVDPTVVAKILEGSPNR